MRFIFAWILVIMLALVPKALADKQEVAPEAIKKIIETYIQSAFAQTNRLIKFDEAFPLTFRVTCTVYNPERCERVWPLLSSAISTNDSFRLEQRAGGEVQLSFEFASKSRMTERLKFLERHDL